MPGRIWGRQKEERMGHEKGEEVIVGGLVTHVLGRHRLLLEPSTISRHRRIQLLPPHTTAGIRVGDRLKLACRRAPGQDYRLVCRLVWLERPKEKMPHGSTFGGQISLL